MRSNPSLQLSWVLFYSFSEKVLALHLSTSTSDVTKTQRGPWRSKRHQITTITKNTALMLAIGNPLKSKGE